MGEKQHTQATEYDQYFITRGLDLLRPGGLLVLLVTVAFTDSTKAYQTLKKRVADKAVQLERYRLPNGIFESTDVGTQILVLQKRK